MQVNDIVTVNVVFDACAVTGATRLTIVGSPHVRNVPRRFEAFGLSTERGANGLNGSIPTMLDKINIYTSYESPNSAQIYLELEPIRNGCSPGQVHKWYLETEGIKGTYKPSQTVPINRSATVLTPIRLLGRPADGRHPWSPAASCQVLYQNLGLTQSGWWYIVDPIRSNPSYRPSKYVFCNVTSATPLAVSAWGYRRYVARTSAVTGAQMCASQMGGGATLASFSSQAQYDAIISEMQSPLAGAGNPNFGWWIGLQHNATQPYGPNTAYWFFVDGARNFNVGTLWAPNNPVRNLHCVTARLTIDTGVARGGSLNSWTAADSLSLFSADCTAIPAGNSFTRGPLCFGPLPVYAGAS